MSLMAIKDFRFITHNDTDRTVLLYDIIYFITTYITSIYT